MTQVDIFLERLAALIAEKDGTERAASMRIFGNDNTIRSFRRHRNIPKGDYLDKLAQGYTVTTDYLLGKAAQATDEVTLADVRLSYRAAGRPDRSLPIWGSALGHDLRVGAEGVVVEQTMLDPADTIGYAARPEKLQGVTSAYAVYIQGESMAPRWEPGDLAIVDPRKPARNGDDVIVQLIGEPDVDGESRVVCVLIKRLVRRTATHVELLQYQPQETTFRIEIGKIAAMHRIVRENQLFDS